MEEKMKITNKCPNNSDNVIPFSLFIIVYNQIKDELPLVYC